MTDELSNVDLQLLDRILQIKDLLGNHESAGAGPVDHHFAPLDSFGYLDLALAGQKRNGAHFPKVHAHRIIGLLQCAGSQIELDSLGLGILFRSRQPPWL